MKGIKNSYIPIISFLVLNISHASAQTYTLSTLVRSSHAYLTKYPWTLKVAYTR